MTWTVIANGDIDQGSPLTVDLMTALRDNPEGLAAQDTGAPKIADKITGGSATSGNLDFASLDDFSGILIWGVALSTAAASQNISLNYSTDGGSTFGTAETLFAAEQDQITPFQIFLDFASGNYFASGGRALFASGTIGGASLAIDLVRLTIANTQSLSAIAKPQGGQSAS